MSRSKSLLSLCMMDARGISHSVFDNQNVSDHDPWLRTSRIEWKIWHFIHANFYLDEIEKNDFRIPFHAAFAITCSGGFRDFGACGCCFPVVVLMDLSLTCSDIVTESGSRWGIKGIKQVQMSLVVLQALDDSRKLTCSHCYKRSWHWIRFLFVFLRQGVTL